VIMRCGGGNRSVVNQEMKAGILGFEIPSKLENGGLRGEICNKQVDRVIGPSLLSYG